ncbi:MAG: hypothetical protein HOW97_08160 [Catenulispora sp.]|nr:hypothetical protein [Catenulispora sp.]
MSVGSILGGLAYGAVDWPLPNRSRLPLLAAALGLCVAAAALAPNVWALTGITAATGIFISPLMTCAYLVADELAAEDARTAAGAWVNNAFNAGSSGGYAAMGTALVRLPLGWCFVIAATPVLIAAGVARAWRARVGRSAVHTDADSAKNSVADHAAAAATTADDPVPATV